MVNFVVDAPVGALPKPYLHQMIDGVAQSDTTDVAVVEYEEDMSKPEQWAGTFELIGWSFELWQDSE